MTNDLIRVAGLDLSLTGTGMSRIVIPRTGTPVFEVTKIGSVGKDDDSLNDRLIRLRELSRQAIDYCRGADLCAVEGPLPGAKYGHPHDRSGLWWLTVGRLIALGFPVVEVAPKGRAKYATGNGNAGKDMVIAHTTRRFPQVTELTDGDNNMCDAINLAAIAARYLGRPVEESIPQTSMDAFDAVHWEDVEELRDSAK